MSNPEHPLFIREGNIILKSLDTTITSLVIPEGIEYIRENAFQHCTQLVSVTFPSSLLSLGERAFQGCTQLASLTLPTSLCLIGESAFHGCTSLSSIEIPEGVHSIHTSAFELCTSLVSVTLPESLDCLEDSVFRRCEKLSQMNLPHGIDHLGEQLFRGCSSLHWQTLPDTISSLGVGVFADCDGLTSFTIPATVKYLGAVAFMSCRNLKSVTILADLQEIPEECFCSCVALEEIHLPPTVTRLGHYAFASCESLQQIHLPPTIKDMGDSVFHHCKSLESIVIPFGIPRIPTEGFAHCTALRTIEIPESVQHISELAMEGCIALESVVIPDSVVKIDRAAFFHCHSLEEVHLSQSLQMIDDFVFYQCDMLERIYQKPCFPPCLWATTALPQDMGYEFLDMAVLANLTLRDQYYYCVVHWEGTQQKEMCELLFSLPHWVDFALGQDFLPLILLLLPQVETLSLPQLGDYIQWSIERRTTEITAIYLEYRNKHYREDQVESYYQHKDLVSCGLAPPTYEEFSRLWYCEMVQGKVHITGYRGHKQEEVIPKALDYGVEIEKYFHEKQGASTNTLKHLRIEADLQECLCTHYDDTLETLEVMGTVFGTFSCDQCVALETVTYGGKGDQGLSLYLERCNLHEVHIAEGVPSISTLYITTGNNLFAIHIPTSVERIDDVSIDDMEYCKVYGKIGSVAESYCKDHGISFVEMTEENL